MLETIKGLFVGLTTVDALYLVDSFPQPNQKTVASRYGLFAGGPATNAAITFALLGGDATLVASVGTGALGVLARHELSDAGVALVDCAPSPDFAPALSTIFSVPATGTRNIVTAHVPRRNSPQDDAALGANIDFAELLRAADVLLLDGHNLPWALPAAHAARARGVPVVLDGGSWKTGLETLLPLVDAAICSEDFRLPEVSPATSAPSDVLAGLQTRGVCFAAVSRGGKPLVYATAKGIGEIPIPASAIVDTLGSGDVLHGAFAFFYAQNGDFPLALERAARVASFSCGYFGPREGITEWRRRAAATLEGARRSA